VPAWVVPAFVAGALASLLASARLVRALEHLGAYLGAPEVLLGLVVALAADGPELTSSLTAQIGGQHALGAGVLFGSNVFNIAVLLGVGSVVAGRVAFHRRVVVFEGATALAVAASGLALVSGAVAPVVALSVTLAFFVPYVVVAAVPPSRLPLPATVKLWLGEAVEEEAEDVAQAYVPPASSRWAPAALTAAVASGIVVLASALMEHAASVGGARLGAPQVIVGGTVLAAVTSLPNAVGAVYLARAGRGAAVLSEAMNSNTINVVGGFVLPALLGDLVISQVGAGVVFAGAAYVVLTGTAIGLGYTFKGLGRGSGVVLIVAYIVFVAALAVIA